MGRGQAIFMTLLCAGFSALFGWMLLSSPDSRLLGFGGLLFAGSCGLVALSFVFPAEIPPVAADGSLTIDNSTLRCFLCGLACVGFVVASIIGNLLEWTPVKADTHGWTSYSLLLIPIPAAMLAVKYFQWALGGQPAYRLDATGLTRYHWGERTVPWTAIAQIRTMSFRGSRQLVLDVTPEFRRTAPWYSRLGAALDFGDLTLSTATSGVDSSALEAIVRKYWAAHVK